MTERLSRIEQRQLKKQGLKQCGRCFEILPLTSFNYHESHGFYSGKCQPCDAEYQKEYRVINERALKLKAAARYQAGKHAKPKPQSEIKLSIRPKPKPAPEPTPEPDRQETTSIKVSRPESRHNLLLECRRIRRELGIDNTKPLKWKWNQRFGPWLFQYIPSYKYPQAETEEAFIRSLMPHLTLPKILQYIELQKHGTHISCRRFLQDNDIIPPDRPDQPTVTSRPF